MTVFRRVASFILVSFTINVLTEEIHPPIFHTMPLIKYEGNFVYAEPFEKLEYKYRPLEFEKREYRPLQFGKRDYRPLQFGKRKIHYLQAGNEKKDYRPLQFGKRTQEFRPLQFGK